MDFKILIILVVVGAVAISAILIVNHEYQKQITISNKLEEIEKLKLEKRYEEGLEKYLEILDIDEKT